MGCCCVCGRNWCYDIRASCVVVICRLSCPSPVCYVIYLLFAVLVPTASLIGRPWVVLCFLRHEIVLLYSVCLDIFLFLCHEHDVFSFCSFSEGCSINDIVSHQIVSFTYLSLCIYYCLSGETDNKLNRKMAYTLQLPLCHVQCHLMFIHETLSQLYSVYGEHTIKPS